MKVLIIGFGSIGKRHYEVLSQLSEVQNIDLVTKQNIEDKNCYINLEIIKNIEEYDYFVIASKTNKHFEQLNFLEKNVKDKLIFCEKPLFESKQDLEIKNNRLFIGYVLRFHPLLEKLKEFVKNEKIILLNAKCGQYLPSWRVDTDYRKCYSSKKEEGGGVLLDLSHEIDYVQWLCGQINELQSYQVKISDLEINSDDLTMLIGKTNQDIFINISIDYISKITHRKLLIETLEYTYELDFIENKLIKKDKTGFEEIFSSLNLKRNYMFEQMHLDIFNQQKNICTFKEALEVMQTISTIQEQNL
ncbi:oxidoreductase [Aliarcobacter cryaerophilus ATCC 43158]|uniref:Glucosamine-6-P synthase, isomerase subunit PtmF n=1 Tax=Aliarcobacter cryaerophilus ATCC 43158 TaxID=1032070 RepID=A0AAD0TVV8_9BACT|nr:Gfo/Idh/MocA family oxidoreductase [Aliarcobacter cryaerophilus]AYJ79318.1 glucosamine-6-P synthase, isomerase subunit PtmF [Aliarcobacter cryaerophilus ATCC 43158]PRM97973.1 oxidoreductase [Aliarcobacter cryaerophilus]QCZ23582.1 oxidoreductase [Aliarcobacter cryaerophilus ATCC 43158]